jgi:L-ascorbate metabolism protein UlaG (beta-lactamase superfamily)
MNPALALTFVGHSTVLIEMDNVRLLTDPVLRRHVGHLHRIGPDPDQSLLASIDAVLISHAHWDHLDVGSLRQLGTGTQLIVPRGAGKMLLAKGFEQVTELTVGAALEVNSVRITATIANHHGRRPPFGPTPESVGYVVEGSERIYFAGDTDLFPEMKALAGDLGLALLPVWGYGPNLGPGHLDPQRAAEALTILQPRPAVPIHWGTLAPYGLHLLKPGYLRQPPQAFAAAAAKVAPGVTVRILAPGEHTGLILPRDFRSHDRKV